MMGMRVSFDIDYSSLWRSGEPGRRFRLALSRAPDREDPRIDRMADPTRTAPPDSAERGMLLRAAAP